MLALALALSVLPIAALAQDTNAPPQLTDSQRQQLHQAFEQFGQAESRLHDQLRYQILSSLTPVHRRAIGAAIGELAITPNPDVDGLAQRIDAMLMGAERSRIMAAHQAFDAQSKQLRDQMRTQMQSLLPSGGPMGNHPPRSNNGQRRQLDAGHIVLFDLMPHGGHMMGGMMPPPGAAPQ